MSGNVTVNDINVLTMVASSKLILLKKLEKCMSDLKDQFQKNEDFDVEQFVQEQQNCIADIDRLELHFQGILSNLDEETGKIIRSIMNNTCAENLSNWSDRLNQTIREQRTILLSLQAINTNNAERAEKLCSQLKAKIKAENRKKCIQENYVGSNSVVGVSGAMIEQNESLRHKPIFSLI